MNKWQASILPIMGIFNNTIVDSIMKISPFEAAHFSHAVKGKNLHIVLTTKSNSTMYYAGTFLPVKAFKSLVLKDDKQALTDWVVETADYLYNEVEKEYKKRIS